jgi:hypothetical protein
MWSADFWRSERLTLLQAATVGCPGAKGVPVERVQGSPFNDYSVPSLILFIVVVAFRTACVDAGCPGRVLHDFGEPEVAEG